jgi:hypothetical protein
MYAAARQALAHECFLRERSSAGRRRFDPAGSRVRPDALVRGPRIFEPRSSRFHEHAELSAAPSRLQQTSPLSRIQPRWDAVVAASRASNTTCRSLDLPTQSWADPPLPRERDPRRLQCRGQRRLGAMPSRRPDLVGSPSSGRTRRAGAAGAKRTLGRSDRQRRWRAVISQIVRGSSEANDAKIRSPK